MVVHLLIFFLQESGKIDTAVHTGTNANIFERATVLLSSAAEVDRTARERGTNPQLLDTSRLDLRANKMARIGS